MAKVFGVKSEVRETQYLTLLWIRILRRVEFEARARGKIESDLVQTLNQNLYSVCASDMRFLIQFLKKEENFIKEKFFKQPKKTIEMLKEKIYEDFENKRARQMLKRLTLYLIHIKRKESFEVFEQELSWIITFVNGEHKDKLLDLVNDYSDILVSNVDKSLFQNFTITLLSLISGYMSGSEQKDNIKEFYQNHVLTAISELILNSELSNSILTSLINGKTEVKPFSLSLEKVIDHLVCKRQGKPSSSNGMIRHAKISMLIDPSNRYIRFMSNCIMFESKNFGGVFSYDDFDDINDSKLFGIFGDRKWIDQTGALKKTKLKQLFLQNPEKIQIRNITSDLRNKEIIDESMAKNEVIDTKIEDPEQTMKILTEKRTKVILNSFSFNENEIEGKSAHSISMMVQKYENDEQQRDIRIVAMIDCLLLFLNEMTDNDQTSERRETYTNHVICYLILKDT